LPAFSWLFFLVAAPPACAETLEAQYGNAISDDALREAIGLALTKIDKSMCGSQKPCAPATPEELTQPPITVLDARTAMTFGIKWALMRWCTRGPKLAGGVQMLLDWRRWEKKMSSRQVQLAILIREDFYGRQLASLAKLGPCPELDRELPGIRFGPSSKF
jgi:hypothetical protein